MGEAEQRGAAPGRPRKLDETTARAVRDEIASGRTHAAIAREMGVHPTTIMRLVGRLTEPD